MNKLKFYISQFQEMTSHEVMGILKTSEDLSTQEKNLVYLYLYPRPLLDMELPPRIMSYRGQRPAGSLEPDLGEVALLLEAYRGEQYHRYFKHLCHSFTDPHHLFPVAGDSQSECGLCGKNLYNLGAWQTECTKWPGSTELERKEYLAYGSDCSSICLCRDCLVQLKYTSELLEELEPGYLDWTRRLPKRS